MYNSSLKEKEKDDPPGTPWYESSIDRKEKFSSFEGSTSSTVTIIGGGLTGLGAAYNLAASGVDVVLLEAGQLAGAASSRNGGQLGTGQRCWPEDLEKIYGFERSQQLFTIMQEAKQYLLSVAEKENFSIDYRKGQISTVHSKRLLGAYRQHVEALDKYGYREARFIEREELAARLGSQRYYGGVYDAGTGHINPLKAALGLAEAATKKGARIFEKSLVVALEKQQGGYKVKTQAGEILSQHVLLATNAKDFTLAPEIGRYIVPIHSYIGATQILPEKTDILPFGDAVDDSRFAVRYFRKTPEGALLFGGVENYGTAYLSNIESAIRRQLYEIYPQLKGIKFTHLWGGTVGITVQRMPLIRKLDKNLIYCGGYSGHGVLLAPYIGKLYADYLLQRSNHLQILKELKISRFWGGRFIQKPLVLLALFSFSLLDKF